MVRNIFEVDEWYHCYNRGIDKRTVFGSEDDATRFLMALYLANGTRPMEIHNLYKPTLQMILKEERGTEIVSVGAYCLMPNHYHLLLKEIAEGGITSFMRRLGTAYAMYFNARNERVGNVFLRPFRSRHVGTDEYFQRVLHYIHCNPAEIFEKGWKSGEVKNLKDLETKLKYYQYSSLRRYTNSKHKDPILSKDGFLVVNQLPFSRMLKDAQQYYAEISTEPIFR